LILGLDTDGEAAGGGIGFCVIGDCRVDLEHGRGRRCVGEVVLGFIGLRSRDVMDEALRGIVAREVVEVVEEVSSRD